MFKALPDNALLRSRKNSTVKVEFDFGFNGSVHWWNKTAIFNRIEHQGCDGIGKKI